MEKVIENISVELIEDGTIISQKIIGILTYEKGLELTNLTGEAVAKTKNPDKVRLLVDVTEAGKIDSKARKHLIANTTRSNLYKLAIFKSKPYIRAVLNFVSIVTGKKNIKVFKDKESAIQWLKK